MINRQDTIGWGIAQDQGIEMWDARPVFYGDNIKKKDLFKLLFYPKKLLLYLWIWKAYKNRGKVYRPFRILDVGCGTGAGVIEMKSLFGNQVEVVGIDVIQLQHEIAEARLQEYHSDAKVILYDGKQIPFQDEFFDAVHSSDVLGHVEDVPAWLNEINRVLKPGGALAMFSESKLGKHAYIRNYLMKRGLNTDPHAEFHISLYSRDNLLVLINNAHFEIEKTYTTVWAKFFVHPDEIYPALSSQKRFFLFKVLNRLMCGIKRRTHPVSTAAAEFYSLIEMLVVGRKIQSQGYVILGKKKHCS